ncbi:hypothetical protein D3C71_1469800 [compost metagenome]
MLCPCVYQCETVLAEQTRDVVPAVGGYEGVVGLVANVVDAGNSGLGGVAAIGNADGIGIKQAVDEAAVRQVGQTHYARSLAFMRECRNIRQQLHGGGVEHLDATGRVILRSNQRSVGADGAPDRVASLLLTCGDPAGEEVDAGHGAIAPKHIGVAAIAGENHRRVREVTQPRYPCQNGMVAGVDEQDGACCALDHHPQVSGAHQRLRREGGASAGQ